MSPATIAVLQNVGTAAAIIGFQVYNVWEHRKHSAKIAETADSLSAKTNDVDELGREYADMRNNLEQARDAIERMAIKVNDGDRRTTRTDAAAKAGTPARRRTDARA